jgi:hypothetical protein
MNFNLKKFGLLLGRRAEILSSSAAIMHSPIIGHGSWANAPMYIDIDIHIENLDAL